MSASFRGAVFKMLEGRFLSMGFFGLLWGLDYLTLRLTIALILLVFLATGGQYTLYLAYHTLGRDLRGAFRYLRLLFLVYTYQKRNMTVPKVSVVIFRLFFSQSSIKKKD